RVEYGTTTAYGTSTPTTSTRQTAHSVTLTNLTAGTAYQFRVHSVNSSGSPASSQNSSFTTSAALAITGVQVTGITPTGATITWTTNLASDSQVQYGATTAYGSATAVTATRQLSHSVNLSGLTAGTQYQFRARSADAEGAVVLSGNYSFTTSSNLAVTAVQVSGITATGATITWTTSAPADSQVQYGTTTSYGSATPVSATRQTSHSVTLSGLTGGTTYQYRVRSADAAGTVALSGNFSFATQAALTATGVQAIGVTASGATITWTTNQAADSQVQYGTTTAYGTSTPITTSRQTSHSVTLSGLAAGQTYQYRVRSANASGAVVLSGNFSFTTSSALTISGVQVSGVTTSGATITWTTSEAANSQVQYGTTISYGQSTAVTATRQTAHSVTLTGLASGTAYYFRARSVNLGGTVALSPDFSFTTAQVAPTTVTIIVDTTPTGLPVQVDGATLTAPQTFQWTPGSSHTLGALSPVGSGRSRSYFQRWSDGGPQSRTISVPASAARYTAIYVTRHKLAGDVVPRDSGTLVAAPFSADDYCEEGSPVVRAATSNSEPPFLSLQGDLTSKVTPRTVMMTGPLSIVTAFATGLHSHQSRRLGNRYPERCDRRWHPHDFARMRDSGWSEGLFVECDGGSRGPAGYRAMWPTGQARPAISPLNSVDGQVTANSWARGRAGILIS
ncbi:MAG: fibronectin type III domain-containing protein, partial [Bryobacteraceae bacterium]|nr:fibronectin type III domain-containing protein [Bryobacteraceae bacterium]